MKKYSHSNEEMPELLDDIVCPVCKGVGKIEIPYGYTRDWKVLRKNMILTLLKSRFSYRQIAKLVGLKSTRTIFKMKSGK